MTKPLRIAAKVWLCLTTAAFWSTLIVFAVETGLRYSQIFVCIFLALTCIGFIGLVLFWEKLTR